MHQYLLVYSNVKSYVQEADASAAFQRSVLNRDEATNRRYGRSLCYPAIQGTSLRVLGLY
jgi:hypothetical protein